MSGRDDERCSALYLGWHVVSVSRCPPGGVEDLHRLRRDDLLPVTGAERDGPGVMEISSPIARSSSLLNGWQEVVRFGKATFPAHGTSGVGVVTDALLQIPTPTPSTRSVEGRYWGWNLSADALDSGAAQ